MREFPIMAIGKQVWTLCIKLIISLVEALKYIYLSLRKANYKIFIIVIFNIDLIFLKDVIFIITSNSMVITTNDHD